MKRPWRIGRPRTARCFAGSGAGKSSVDLDLNGHGEKFKVPYGLQGPPSVRIPDVAGLPWVEPAGDAQLGGTETRAHAPSVRAEAQVGESS